jgi:hypothetical protein
VSAATHTRPPTSLVYDLLECWLLWRTACDDVDGAYARWRASAGRERRTAFEIYRSALDREETAAGIYSVSIGRMREAEDSALGGSSTSS